MNRFKQNIEKYADLAVRTGVNLQQGQTLVIRAHSGITQSQMV